MYAIVDIKNSQYKVSEGEKLLIDKTGLEPGSSLECDKVILCKTDKDILIGQPYVKGAKVKLEVLKEQKGKKLYVFKYKRRKDYRKMHGHRQKYDEVLVKKIEI